MHQTSFAVVASLLTLVGCGNDAGVERATAGPAGNTCERNASDSAPSDVAVRDSGDILVVENSPGSMDSSAVVRIDGPPTVVIGTRDGPEPYLFGKIADAMQLPDSTIIIADAMTADLTVFNSEGVFVRRIGREGPGPGEYEHLHSFFRVDPDTLVVVDNWGDRLTYLSLDGEVLTTKQFHGIRFEGPEGISGTGRPLVFGRFADGTYLVLQRILAPSPVDPSPGEASTRRTEFPLNRIAADGTLVDSLGLFVQYETTRVLLKNGYLHMSSRPFGVADHVFVGSQTFWRTSGDAYEIRELNPDGATVRIIRLCKDRSPVTRRAIQMFRTHALDEAAPAHRRDKEAELELIPYPQLMPALTGVMLDPLGRVWAREYNLPGQRELWHVFDEQGRWKWAVEMPPEVTVLQIADRHVVTQSSDRWGVETIRLYDLPAKLTG